MTIYASPTSHISGRGPSLDDLRREVGKYLPQEYVGHPLERLRLTAMANRLRQGLPPTEPAPPTPTFEPLTHANLAAHYNWPSLDQLTTAHMTAEQARGYTHILELVRAWRNFPADHAKAAVLASPSVGIGKTHIATAVAASYRAIWSQGDQIAGFVDGKPNFETMSEAKMLTANALMAAMDAEDFTPATLIPRHIKCLVVDDVGREGDIKYTKRDPESQKQERQQRYFELINYLYERKNCDLFITTNLTATQLAQHFNDATMSRLTEMASGRYILDIRTKYPDMRIIRAKAAA